MKVALVPGKGIRHCSPVRCVSDPDRIGVVVDSHPTMGVLVLWSWGSVCAWRDRDSIALDLTEATGRAHAAMAITRRMEDFTGWHPWRGSWGNGEVMWGAPGAHSADVHLPALADLDITDDTRLHDGSRLVDAMALAIVLAAS